MKKPVAIESVQYRDQMRVNDCLPEGVVIMYWAEFNADLPTIKTPDGTYVVSDGDYIITEKNGEKSYLSNKEEYDIDRSHI